MEEKNKAWKTVSSKYLFRRPWLTVRCEDMLLPNGNHIPEYYILEYPDWVNTIAITKDGQFVFVRQYRPGIERTCYELCAGVCEKEDASPLVSAQREKCFAPFRACVEAGALTIMVNSGSINGKPVHADRELLTQWLKEDLGWDGMLITDWACLQRGCNGDAGGYLPDTGSQPSRLL